MISRFTGRILDFHVYRENSLFPGLQGEFKISMFTGRIHDF